MFSSSPPTTLVSAFHVSSYQQFHKAVSPLFCTVVTLNSDSCCDSVFLFLPSLCTVQTSASQKLATWSWGFTYVTFPPDTEKYSHLRFSSQWQQLFHGTHTLISHITLYAITDLAPALCEVLYIQWSLILLQHWKAKKG